MNKQIYTGIISVAKPGSNILISLVKTKVLQQNTHFDISTPWQFWFYKYYDFLYNLTSFKNLQLSDSGEEVIGFVWFLNHHISTVNNPWLLIFYFYLSLS